MRARAGTRARPKSALSFFLWLTFFLLPREKQKEISLFVFVAGREIRQSKFSLCPSGSLALQLLLMHSLANPHMFGKCIQKVYNATVLQYLYNSCITVVLCVTVLQYVYKKCIAVLQYICCFQSWRNAIQIYNSHTYMCGLRRYKSY